MEPHITTPSVTPALRYRLELEDKTRQLVGVVEPPRPVQNHSEVPIPGSDTAVRPPQPITLRTLQEHINKEGYSGYYFMADSIALFLKKIQRFETGRYILAEQRDAKIHISIAFDKLSARVQTEQAWGGEPLTEEKVLAEIKKAKIATETISVEKLAIVSTSAESVDIILANAIEPVQGVNAELKPLIDSKNISEKDTDTTTAIDQLDVFQFAVVNEGDPLLRKIPATKGEHGIDVRGKKIKANAGKDLKFQKPFEGVALAEDDENLLVATQKGHPVFSPMGVKVDPLMQVKNVDIHSGHIDYDGSLFVKENIEPGLNVTVTGDVFVKGSITKATVKASGSIIVTGGVNADDIDDDHSCHLEAGGDVTAKFFHHASVHCRGDLIAHEYIMQSRIIADGYINVGQERGRGCLIGGHCTTHSGVSAKVIGSEAYVTTVISIGEDSEREREIASLKKKIKRREFEKEQLSLILSKIQSQSKPTKLGRTTLDKARKIDNTIKAIEDNILHMQYQVDEYASHAIQPSDLAVKITDRIFPNVMINILGHAWSCEETRRRCQILLQRERIQIENL